MAMKQWLRCSVSALVMASLMGCETAQQFADQASSGFDSIFTDAYLADTNDACLPQREQLADQAEPLIADEVWQGALAGAAAGALGALIIGENPLYGALIGGAFGAAGGYLAKLQSEGRSPFEIISGTTENIARENEQIDQLLAAFNTLSDCRKREARVIQRAFNNNEITRDAARVQMADQRAKFDEDVSKFREIANDIAENTESYAAIYNDVAADNDRNALEVQDYQRGKRSARVTQAKATKVIGTEEGSLTVADKSNVKKLQNECLTNVRKRDDCFEAVERAETAKNSPAFSDDAFS